MSYERLTEMVFKQERRPSPPEVVFGCSRCSWFDEDHSVPLQVRTRRAEDHDCIAYLSRLIREITQA